MKDFYRRCSICKTPIAWEAEYFTCSVSTCNQKRTALFFCSLPCWDAHLPESRHRDAWAEKQVAPRAEEETPVEKHAAGPTEKRRRVVSSRTVQPSEAASQETALLTGEGSSSDVLVVVSKLKGYIRDRSSMNTSSGVASVLSDHLRELADRAIVEAHRNERKTVLDRDFLAVLERMRGGSSTA